MAIFRFLKMAAAAIVDFENFTFSTVGTVEATYVIMPNFIEIARTADVILFLIFLIFNGRTRQDGRTAPLCQISTKPLQLRPTW